MYVVAVISIDRYVRIKDYANFKRIWTTLALFQALMVTMAFILRKPRIGNLPMLQWTV